MEAKMTVRIWENSKLIKKKVKDVEKKFNVRINKVSRGPMASDSKEIRIENADYITFEGHRKELLNLFDNTH